MKTTVLRCLTCGAALGGGQHAGCCPSCYEGHRWAIRKGQATRAELAAKGLILPGRKRKPPEDCDGS